MLRFTVFRTKWGFFGLAGTDDTLALTSLPIADRDAAAHRLLLALKSADDDLRRDPGILPSLQERIIAYFEGENVDFSTDPPLLLDHATTFARRVLCACRTIPYGRTRTYSDLAEQVGSPGAARAVGSVMASNPIPLLIPCHRVLRTDGGLGGFSAPGGTAVKQRMLERERSPNPCRA